MTAVPDIIEYIRAALTTPEPLTQTRVDQTLQQVRQTFGGETVYIRAPRIKVTRRTTQRRQRAGG